MPRQDSLTDQMRSVMSAAIDLGCYDAADWIRDAWNGRGPTHPEQAIDGPRERPIHVGAYVIFTAGGRTHEGHVVDVIFGDEVASQTDLATVKSSDTGQTFSNVPLEQIHHYYAANH